MKKIFYIIVLFAFGFQSFGQTNFYCTKNITLTDCKVNFINSTPLRWAQLDANLMTWSKDASNSYVIKDGNTQVTIKNDGCLISPTFNALGDSLTAWQLRCLQIRRLDTIIGKLTTVETTDTLKGLVFTPKAKTVTNIDTLFNCKSISFGRKSTASGTLILTYEDGDSESFDVANDDLPTWVNGEFISFLAYKATGATGLILSTLGCSQTDSEICAKVKPIFDCTLSVPINCVGWGSASGVWNTISGCWNTGQ